MRRRRRWQRQRMEMETEDYEDLGIGSQSSSTSYSLVENCLICGGSDTDCQSNPDLPDYRLPPYANGLDGLIRLLLWEKSVIANAADSEGNNSISSTNTGTAAGNPDLETALKSADYCMKCVHQLDEVFSLLERLQELKTTVISKLEASYNQRRKNADQIQKLRGRLLRATEAGSRSSIGSRVRVGARRAQETDPESSSTEWTPNANKRLRLLPFARDLLAPDPNALAQAQVQVKLELIKTEQDSDLEEPPAGFWWQLEPIDTQWRNSTPAPSSSPARRKREYVRASQGQSHIPKKKKSIIRPQGERTLRKRWTEQLRKASKVSAIKRKLTILEFDANRSKDGHAGSVNVDQQQQLERQLRQLMPPRPPPPPPEIFLCYACQHVSETKGEHDEHRAHCKVNCASCGLPSSRGEAMQAHIRAAHPELPRGPGECAVSGCGTKCKNLTIHYVSTHQTEFSCHTCGAEFTAFLEYNHHLRSHPELHLPPVQCPDCGRLFKNHKGLIVHAAMKHRRSNRFLCDRPACGCTFPSAAELQVHVRRKHEGVRDFQCELCPQSFTDPWLLRDHMRRHAGVEVKKNVCPEPGCGKAFKMKGKLRDHQAAVHGPGGAGVENPHICDQCGKSFPIKNYLYVHLRSHETPEEKMARRLKAEQAREERRRNGLPVLIAKGRPRIRPVRERGGCSTTTTTTSAPNSNQDRDPQQHPAPPPAGPASQGRSEDQLNQQQPFTSTPPVDKDSASAQLPDQEKQLRIIEDLLKQAEAEAMN